MGTVLGYLRPHGVRVACGVTVKFTAALLELVLPLLLEHIVDVSVPARDLAAIWICGGLMAALAFGAAFCNITANRMAAWVSMEVTKTLRGDLYSRTQRLSCAQMDRFSASSLVSRLTNDTYNVHQMFDKVQRGGIRAPMLVLGGLVLTLRVDAGQMPPGQIVAFLSYFTLIQTATLGIAKVFIRISKGAASARRIEEILLEPEDQLLRTSEAASGAELGMEGVSFSYLGVERDLADVTFSLKKGETLGVLGPTGSGKSTLAALLMRLYDAGEGVVWVGGRDVGSIPQAALRSRFGMVFQNEALLNDSVYENISFLRNIPREEVAAAAKTAQAWDFIQALPEGLDSRLDIRGANLSGGQRQRLLVARALAGKPAVLVLDSADSALDYATAAALRAAVRRDCPGVTLVVISERVASLRDADRILVLEEGRVAELQKGVLL